MSPTMLAKRLRTLEEFGVVHRQQSGRNTAYELTAAGEELRPIVMSLGHWGARWIGSRLRPDQLDAGFLMWDVRRFVRLDEFPPGRRVVIHFHFPDARPRERHWWLVVEDQVADLCRDDPGHELTLEVRSSLRALTEIWTGDTTPAPALHAREIQVIGTESGTPTGYGTGSAEARSQTLGEPASQTGERKHDATTEQIVCLALFDAWPFAAQVANQCTVSTAGSNSSMRLPAGSASRIWRPPGPATRSLRKDSPALRSRSISESRSSTIRWMRL